MSLPQHPALAYLFLVRPMIVPQRLWILPVAVSLLTPRVDAYENQKQSVRMERPMVYNYVGKGSESADNTKAKPLYREKFRIIDFSADRGYTRSKVTKKLIPRPVIENGRSVKGDVRVVLVVNQVGRPIMPFVLSSTNSKLNQAVLNVIAQWRGTPALLNGRPIAVLLHQDFRFN
jgi:hypothetical protein